MRKQLIIGITAALIGAGTLTAGIASAKGGWDRCGSDEGHHSKYERMEGKHQMRMSSMADKLGLSDAQKDQMQALMKNKREQMKGQRGGMKGMHNAFQDLDVNASDYDQQVAALVTEAQQKTAEMIQMRAQQKKAMFEILTQEQQEKYLEMRR